MNRLLAEKEKVQEQAKLVERIMRATASDANGKNAYYSLLDIAHLQWCGRYKEGVSETGAKAAPGQVRIIFHAQFCGGLQGRIVRVQRIKRCIISEQIRSSAELYSRCVQRAPLHVHCDPRWDPHHRPKYQ